MSSVSRVSEERPSPKVSAAIINSHTNGRAILLRAVMNRTSSEITVALVRTVYDSILPIVGCPGWPDVRRSQGNSDRAVRIDSEETAMQCPSTSTH